MESTQAVPTPTAAGDTLRIEPDLRFVRELKRNAGDNYKKCMQCGCCTATCSIAPDTAPFPRKEMAWAVWGMKDRLLRDPDVWLCYQCNDCSQACPRGARPGDVLAAVRQECVAHYSIPGFFARWISRPAGLPLLLGLPALLLGLAHYWREPLGRALGFEAGVGERITYSYSAGFPHWLINGVFLIGSAWVLVATVVGVVRFWRALNRGPFAGDASVSRKSIGASVLTTFRSIIAHENMDACKQARTRYLSHMCVFFGFLALSLVTLWVITSGFNPLIRGNFIYPFGFWSAWKLLANTGGLALLVGCLIMVVERLRSDDQILTGSYFDWTLLGTLTLVVASGFATEVLHYARLEPHRHIVYFIHLVLVFALLIYLPYTKFAHVIYRTTALVFAEYSGRRVAVARDMTAEATAGRQETADLQDKEVQVEESPA